ncbi:hypothetical protein EIP91_001706 [Steccherinum ochraceum]|uniref:Uncharacterized protein n=1 Tax=Steccherinum ochraceum TaxID=92696 RepID=A0A4R0RFW6_9APHY|nr:hypothetical protein EIP91_001706 [Steccherinum ochraceum]
MEAILSTINASHLRSLFIHVPFQNETPILQFPVPLPSLTELRLSRLLAISLVPAGHPPHTSNVKHLYLLRVGQLPEDNKDHRFPRLIHDLAPNVVHLMLSMPSGRRSFQPYFSDINDFMAGPKSHPQEPNDPTAVHATPGRPARSFPASLVQIVCSIIDDNSSRDPEPALPDYIPQDRIHGYVPRRDEEDRVEAEYVEGFARSWMSFNLDETGARSMPA